jgi:hypothetical protein
MWYYKDSPFTKEDAAVKIEEGYIGFVYEIADTSTGKKYLGKKMLVTKKKLAPLKGQKRKRIFIVQSDWEKYYGSSETVKEAVSVRKEDFQREILDFCKAKGELSYIEAKYQFEREVLLRDDYYNGIINCRINRTHVKSLWKN